MLMPTVGKALFTLKMLRVIDNFIRENLRLVVCISDWLSGIDSNIFSLLRWNLAYCTQWTR